VTFKKPAKMNSEELWDFILKGDAHKPHNTENDQKKLAKRRIAYESIGAITGMVFVLAIYGVILYYLIRIFYPIKLIQAMSISFLMYIIAKIITIPFLSKKNNTNINNYYNDNDFYEDSEN